MAHIGFMIDEMELGYFIQDLELWSMVFMKIDLVNSMLACM